MKSRVSTGVHHARVSNMCSLARVRNLRRSLIMRMYTLLSNTHVYVHGSVVRSSNSTLDTTGDAARIRLSYLNRRERAALDRQRDRIVLEKLVDSRTGIRDSRSRLVNSRSKRTSRYTSILQLFDITLSCEFMSRANTVGLYGKSTTCNVSSEMTSRYQSRL